MPDGVLPYVSSRLQGSMKSTHSVEFTLVEVFSRWSSQRSPIFTRCQNDYYIHTSLCFVLVDLSLKHLFSVWRTTDPMEWRWRDPQRNGDDDNRRVGPKKQQSLLLLQSYSSHTLTIWASVRTYGVHFDNLFSLGCRLNFLNLGNIRFAKDLLPIDYFRHSCI